MKNKPGASALNGPATATWAWVPRMVLATLLAACGGGSEELAGVGSGGTGSTSLGTVTGFGSVFVNGQRFDDSRAVFNDADGPRSRSDLRLGMVVKVQGQTDSQGNASADSIGFDSELLGPVGAIDSTAKTFTVIGQTVAIGAATVFDATLPTGFAALASGQIIEVHGYLNPGSNILQATLIERRASAPESFKIGGVSSGYRGSFGGGGAGGSQSFSIGGQTFSYGGLGIAGIPVGFADGVPFKARVASSGPDASGVWVLTRVNLNNKPLPNSAIASIEGVVSERASAVLFTVGGVRVNATGAAFPDGPGIAVSGAGVEATGRLAAGELLASEVRLEKDANRVDLIGPLSQLDRAAKTFVVRGIVVRYGLSPQFVGGGESTLSEGAVVTVKASVIDSLNVAAIRVQF